MRVHEEGGWREADVLQAADSLSFLETMVPLVLGWSERGYADERGREAAPRARPDRAGADRRARRRRAAGRARAGASCAATRSAASCAPGTPAADAAAPDPARVLAATGLVRAGRMFRLARERFPGMPLFPGHPPFQVLSYRTPQGIRAAGDRPWGPVNDAGLGYMSELVLGSQHTGAHIDAHAHMTVGPEDRWHGGARGDATSATSGRSPGDATEIPPLWRRGVLYDVAGLPRRRRAARRRARDGATSCSRSRRPTASRRARATSRSCARAT